LGHFLVRKTKRDSHLYALDYHFFLVMAREGAGSGPQRGAMGTTLRVQGQGDRILHSQQ